MWDENGLGTPGVLMRPGRGPRPTLGFRPKTISARSGVLELDTTSRSGGTDATSFTTGPANWVHTPTIFDPRAILVTITQPLSSADEVTGVTYGGVAMTRVISTARTITEAMRVYIYVLTVNVADGPQTVSVTTPGSAPAAKQAQAYSINGDPNKQVVVDVSGGGDLGIVANPTSAATFTGPLSSWFGLAVQGYGGAAPVSTGLQAGETYAYGHDPGAAVAMTYYRNRPAAASATTFGYTTLTSDDQLIAWVVLKEVVQYSITPTVEGDRALPLYLLNPTRIVTVTPDGTSKTDWDVVGAASPQAAVTDASDSSYIETGVSGEIERFTFTSYTLASNEYVSGVRVRFRAVTATVQEVFVTPKTPALKALGGMDGHKLDPAQSIIKWYVSWMFPGSGDPWATNAIDRGIMTQTMLDGLTVDVSTNGTAGAGTSKVYELAVDLYISPRTRRIAVRGKKLMFEGGAEARLWGVNWPEMQTFTAAEHKKKMLAHKAKGFNCFRLFLAPAVYKTGSGAGTWRAAELSKLIELLQWMNDQGLYADLTCNCSFYKLQNPSWYEAQTEAERWDERRINVRQFAGMFDQHPAVAYYSLGNELSSPASTQTWWRAGDSDGEGEPLFVEWVVKVPGARTQDDIWVDWLADVMDAADGPRVANPTGIYGTGQVPPFTGEPLSPGQAFFAGLNICLPHIYPERDATWPNDLILCNDFMSSVIQEFFLDIVPPYLGGFAEMEGVYSHAFHRVSGMLGQSDGRTSTDYVGELTVDRQLVQVVMRWFESRSSQFKHKTRGGLRVGDQEVAPRVGGRL